MVRRGGSRRSEARGGAAAARSGVAAGGDWIRMQRSLEEAGSEGKAWPRLAHESDGGNGHSAAIDREEGRTTCFPLSLSL